MSLYAKNNTNAEKTRKSIHAPSWILTQDDSVWAVEYILRLPRRAYYDGPLYFLKETTHFRDCHAARAFICFRL
jgi:hypothetical protein